MAEGEELGRGISSSKNASRARRSNVPYTEFLPRKGDAKISVDRLSLTSLNDLTVIADAREKRPDRQFYGWAAVRVEDAGIDGRRVASSPTDENPYHADIILPSDSAVVVKAIQEEHARKLADFSSSLPCPFRDRADS